MTSSKAHLERWPALGVVLICLAAAGCRDAPSRGHAPASPASAGAEVAPASPGSGDEEPPPASPTAEADQPAVRSEGRWRRTSRRESTELTEEQRQTIERLRSIGYAAGTVAIDRSGVTVHRRTEAWVGLNFYSSGHAPEAVLMDMDGEVLHRWRLGFREVWPDSRFWKKPGAKWWRRVHLYRNGDVLAIFEGLGMIKVDKASNLLWALPNGANHDLEVLADGDIWVLTREATVVPWVHETEPTLEDFLVILDRDGNEKRKISFLEAFRRSPYRELVFQGIEATGDVVHTNTLFVLDGRIADRAPAFKKGSVLASMNHLGVLAVLDPERQEIVWVLKSDPHGQHDPRILDNGNLLVFDNQKQSGRSIVVELDPVAQEPLWQYSGSEDQPFYSKTCGTAQRLPNGNTLITESDSGRAFEVTRDRELVWEFYTPHRAGENGEVIATVAEMLRLPADFPTDWLP